MDKLGARRVEDFDARFWHPLLAAYHGALSHIRINADRAWSGAMSLTLHFLGVGSAQAPELGSACGVLEQDGEPLLMIDCGPEALIGVSRSVWEAAACDLHHAHAHGSRRRPRTAVLPDLFR